MADDHFLELKRGKPIVYDGISFLPITLGYICDTIGLDMFDSIVLPFCVPLDFFIKEDEDGSQKNLFNDYLITDTNMLSSIAICLQIFTGCEEVRKDNDDIVLLFNKENSQQALYRVNSNNFDDISKIIRLIAGKQIVKIEKPPKNMSARQKDVWDKLQEGRKKDAKKNEVHIYDMLNICEYCGNYRISQDELDKMTLWQIKNCYKARTDMKSYDDNLKICLVSGDGKSISGNNHWYANLMIREKS